jgi:uncharacterized protein YecT (DUF1311 family)
MRFKALVLTSVLLIVSQFPVSAEDCSAQKTTGDSLKCLEQEIAALRKQLADADKNAFKVYDSGLRRGQRAGLTPYDLGNHDACFLSLVNEGNQSSSFCRVSKKGQRWVLESSFSDCSAICISSGR